MGEMKALGQLIGRPKRSLAPSRARRQPRRAFTLLETALATIIIGVGVLAIVAAQQAYHKQYQWATHASIAMRLGNEIREMTFHLPRHDPVTGTLNWGPEDNEPDLGAFDDVDDFDGQTFSADDGTGPLNARGEVIPNMPGWTQIVTVANADPSDITISGEPDVPNGSTNMLKVTVVVTYEGPYDDQPEEVTRVWWLSPK